MVVDDDDDEVVLQQEEQEGEEEQANREGDQAMEVVGGDGSGAGGGEVRATMQVDGLSFWWLYFNHILFY
jgi:hypothetical protein